jgi:hypothetical protein
MANESRKQIATTSKEAGAREYFDRQIGAPVSDAIAYGYRHSKPEKELRETLSRISFLRHARKVCSRRKGAS